MKYLLPIVVACLVSLAAATGVRAATLNLEKIGTDDVAGKTFTTWTHYGLNPSLAGSASSSASVLVSVDGVQTATTSGTDGAWMVSPAALDAYGTYEISITSQTENILFSLTLASASGTTTTTSAKGGTTSTTSGATTLPESGFSDLFIFIGVGGLFIASAAASRYVFARYE